VSLDPARFAELGNIGLIFLRLYLHETEHPSLEMLPDVTNHQVDARLRYRGGRVSCTLCGRKSHGFHTILGVRPSVTRDNGSSRRIQRATRRIDSEIEGRRRRGFGRVKNKRTRSAICNFQNIIMTDTWHEYNGLVESGYKKLHDPILFDLDVVREYRMVHYIAYLGGI